jgi:hypothetical protein
MIEVALVGGLVAVVILEYFPGGARQIAEAFKQNPHGLVKYLGAAAVFWLTMGSLPTILLSIYLRQHGFFAFEAFGVNRLSFQILTLNAFFDLAVVTLLLLGIAVPFAFKRRFLLLAQIILWVLGACFLLAIFLGGTHATVAILAFCLLLGGYIYFSLSRTFVQKAKSWGMPLIFASLYLCLPIFNSSWTADFVAHKLYTMRVGAIDVEILDRPFSEKPGVPIAARLLLRTSESYYLKLDSDPQNLVVLDAKSVAVRYKAGQGYREVRGGD